MAFFSYKASTIACRGQACPAQLRFSQLTIQSLDGQLFLFQRSLQILAAEPHGLSATCLPVPRIIAHRPAKPLLLKTAAQLLAP